MVMMRKLALKAKENHFGIALKAFTCVLVFIGVILSILGTLTCQYLGYDQHHSDKDIDVAIPFSNSWSNSSSSNTSITQTLPWEGSTEGWMGLFSYESIETTTNASVYTTHTCMVYPPYVSIGDTSTASIMHLLSRIAAVVAPTLGLLSILVFLVHIAQQCCCRRCKNVSTVNFMLLLSTAGIQGCTLLIFLDSSFW
jgi:hypothetical protein